MLDGDGDGLPGGEFQAEFITLSLTRIPNTDLSGFVFDSNRRNPDGSNIPLAGARIEVEGLEDVFAITDENGFFELVDMPAPESSAQRRGSQSMVTVTKRRFPTTRQGTSATPIDVRKRNPRAACPGGSKIAGSMLGLG